MKVVNREFRLGHFGPSLVALLSLTCIRIMQADQPADDVDDVESDGSSLNKLAERYFWREDACQK